MRPPEPLSTSQISGASRTFVVCDDTRVVGYHALASSAVAPAAAPGRFRRNIPNPIPVVVLGRSAVAVSRHGRGLGRALFQDAGLRVIQAADAIGLRGLTVHVPSEPARDFCLGLGLEESPLGPMTLMIAVADLRAACNSSLP